MKSFANLLARHKFKPFNPSNTSFSFDGPGIAVIAIEKPECFEPIDVIEGDNIFDVAKKIISQGRTAGEKTVALLSLVSQNEDARRLVAQELRAFCTHNKT